MYLTTMSYERNHYISYNYYLFICISNLLLLCLHFFNLNLICLVFCSNLFQRDYNFMFSLHELYDTCAQCFIEARVHILYTF